MQCFLKLSKGEIARETADVKNLLRIAECLHDKSADHVLDSLI